MFPVTGQSLRSTVGKTASRQPGLIVLVLLGLAGCATQGPQRQVTEVSAAPKTDTVQPRAQSRGLILTSATEPSPMPAAQALPEAPALPCPIPPPAQVVPIDLAESLDLAGVENPTIAIARASVGMALAEQQAACALLLPNLNGGGDFDYHTGTLQSAAGAIRQVNRQSFYAGAGAGAFGAGTAYIPGVLLNSNLAEAIFSPVVAADLVAVSRFDAAAVNNTVLLNVGVLYYTLVGAVGRLAAIRQSEQDFAEVARITAAHAEQGQGLPSDADRSRSQLLQMQQEDVQAQEDIAVASAQLAQLLSLDPTCGLTPQDGPVQVLTLVNPAESLENLARIALENRPEMHARTAFIAASQVRYRMECFRPLMPTLFVGYSAGAFGGGSNLVTPSFGNINGRTDLDVYALWTLQNLGLGNLASQKRRRAEVDAATDERTITVNQIRDEVAEAYANAAASRRDLDVARRKLERAKGGMNRDMTRVRGLEGPPIEVLNNASLLASARQEFVRALTHYNQAELRLFVAMGQPPVASGNLR